MKALDSIADQLRRHDDNAPDRGDRQAARVFSDSYITGVRGQYDAALKAALAKLTDEQQKSANAMIENRRKELAPPPEKSER